MTGREVNGYLVVSPARAGSYRGVDRQPWETIDAAYHDRTLPKDIVRLYECIRASPSRGLWWASTSSLEHAAIMLEFTRTREPHAELIAVYSPYLLHEVGREVWIDREAGVLGTDVVSVGEWSLLRALGRSDISPADDITEHINEWGLLRDASAAGRVEDYYRQLSDDEVVEPIAGAGAGIPVEPTTVFQVRR